jgi:hypothetical protein
MLNPFVVRLARSFSSSAIDKRACFGAGKVVLLLFAYRKIERFIACKFSGCYWGTEKFFKKDFGNKVFRGAGKVVDGKVGFMGNFYYL